MARFELVVIRPRKVLNSAKVGANIRRSMRRAADLAKADFQATVASWSSPPGFSIDEVSPAEYRVWTSDRRYIMVDRGTRSHVIVARRAKFLAFRTGYSPKTRPRVIGSTGSSFSGGVVYRRMVRHPGTTARQFSETIAERRRKTILSEVQAAINVGLY